MIDSYKNFARAAQYIFDSPAEIWVGRLDHKAWGKSKNLILYFSEVKTGGQYWLSVFWENGYRSRNGQLDFRNEVEIGDLVELTIRNTRAGKPDIASAKKVIPEAVQHHPQAILKEFSSAKAAFNYAGGYVDRRMLEAALDFRIAIEPDPERFAETCATLDLDDYEQYDLILKAHASSISSAEAAMKQYAKQITPPTIRAMQDAFYAITNSHKYLKSPIATSIVYSSLNRAWNGINGWSP